MIHGREIRKVFSVGGVPEDQQSPNKVLDT